MQYAYNLRNLPTTITYPGSLNVSRGYDNAGRLTSVHDWLGNTTAFGYDANSNLTTETLPSGTGIVDTFTFDAADRLMSISDVKGGSTTLFSATYTRDNANQLTSDSSAPSATGAYRYTALNQICYGGSSNSNSCSSPPSGATAYGYDAADNLTQIGATQQAFNGTDQLCWTAATAGPCGSPPSGATTYTYDARGNRTQVRQSGGGATTLSYDQANRLTAYGSSTTYAYNGDGLRMRKTVSGTTSQFLWDVSSSLSLLIKDGSTAYVYGPAGLPLEQISGSMGLWLHHDQAGSTRLVSDSTGVSQATYSFDVYGNLTSTTGAVTNPLRFAGEYQDLETGFYYLRARYYDPSTAQFISRDVAVATTGEPYSYVDGNPLNGKDPTGLWGYQFDWALGYTSDLGSPASVMAYFQQHPAAVFPFSTGKCSTIRLGERCDLRNDPFFHDAPVRVTSCDSTSFTFTALKGHFDPIGSTITFSVYQKNGVDYLRQSGWWNIHNPLELGKALASVPAANATWSQQAANLTRDIIPGAGADLFSGF